MTAEAVNRAESAAIAAMGGIRRDAPPVAVTVLDTVARGSALWLVIAAALAVKPGARRRSATRGAVAIAAVNVATHLVVKKLVSRRRPTGAGVPAHDVLVPRPTSSAFPSAHTAAATAFTTALLRESPLAAAAVAPLAAVVGYTRVRTRAHWPTDIAVGALLGVAVALPTWRLGRPGVCGR